MSVAAPTLPVPPGPAPLTPGEALGANALSPWAYLTALVREYGDTVRLRSPLGEAYFFNHPREVQAILRSASYVRTSLVTALLGQGLLAAEGRYWRQQRRLVQPVFHERCLAGFYPAISSALADLLHRWETQFVDGQEFDLSIEMRRLALEVIARALFSQGLGAAGDCIHPALAEMMASLGEVAAVFYGRPARFSPERNAAFTQARQVVDDLVLGIVARRRRLAEQPRDLLAVLLEARDEQSGRPLSDQQLRDEVVTMLIAGHDTTALTMGWLWHLLESHPEAEARLLAEVKDALGARLPLLTDLAQLPYTQRVVEETMRFYPPVWATMRRAVEETELDGYRVPTGHFLLVSTWTLHRHQDFWESPERFDPDRFLPERRGRSRPAYQPFGIGRHQCLGQGFAMMEMPLLIAAIAQRYRIRLVPGQSVEAVPSLTLRQPAPYLATFERRK